MEKPDFARAVPEGSRSPGSPSGGPAEKRLQCPALPIVADFKVFFSLHYRERPIDGDKFPYCNFVPSPNLTASSLSQTHFSVQPLFKMTHKWVRGCKIKGDRLKGGGQAKAWRQEKHCGGFTKFGFISRRLWNFRRKLSSIFHHNIKKPATGSEISFFLLFSPQKTT